jgi:hypothetical protein
MDISKLPRLSKTSEGMPESGAEAPPAPAEAGGPAVAQTTSWCMRCNAPNPAGTRFCGNCGAELRPAAAINSGSVEPGVGAEAWISIAVGILLLFLYPNLIRYLAGPAAFNERFQITDENNQPLAYTKSIFFFGDVAITLFAIVLIGEGLVIAFGRRPLLVLIAFILTVTATTVNLFYLGWMMSRGYAFQIMSGLAVAFGVYIALYQWRLWNALRDRPTAARRA